MPRSKEISEDIRRKVVEAHESGKGYKLISKAIGLPKTTIRAILQKWKRFGTVVTLPRSGRPPKISPRARREIIREVMKNPCTTSKDLQATLASSNICVHRSTIRRILGIHGRPTLSSFEDSMVLQASSQEEEDMLDASDGKKEERQVLKNWNTNSRLSRKDNAKCTDNHKEGTELDKSCSDLVKNNHKDEENENRDDEPPLVDVNCADGGGMQAASTKLNRSQDEDEGGGGDSERSDGGNDDPEAATTNLTSVGGADKNKKHDDGTVGSDADNQQDARYTASHDVSGACTNNNNNIVNWSEEMDYISTLTFA